jgi:ubiquinone/menaquinone biosynthesis C-methylase UbiE
MLARARKRLASVPNARLQRVSGRDLRPLPDGYFEFAFAYQVFHHLEREDTLRYLSELHRVLKPGGRVYLQFLNLEVEHLGKELHDYALESQLLQAARRRYFTETEVSVYAELACFDAAYMWTEGDWIYLLAAKPETVDKLELAMAGEPA